MNSDFLDATRSLSNSCSLRRPMIFSGTSLVLLRGAVTIYTFSGRISRMTPSNESLDDLRLFLSGLKMAI